MTSYPEIFAALAAPIPPEDVRQRKQGGFSLSYITARTAMIRLDEVLGPENWRDEYTETRNGVRCRLWYRIAPGGDEPATEWLWKEDGGANAEMKEKDNNEKSGYSDAFKRACVKLGIGRELYNDGVANFGGEESPQEGREDRQERREEPRREERRDDRPRGGGGQGSDDRPPTSGRALFAWAKKFQDANDFRMIDCINTIGKRMRLPSRMTEWSDAEAQGVHQEAMEKYQSTEGRAR